jgi:dextranase
MIKIYFFILCTGVIFWFGTTDISGQITLTSLDKDKALYNPGDTVKIYVNFSSDAESKQIKSEIYYLDSIVSADSIILPSGTSYSLDWIAPDNDFRGYLIKITLSDNGIAGHSSNIAVDVSSDWKKFPRYGFLSKFPSTLTASNVEAIIGNLNRHHINGLQYYDWHYKHHQPLSTDSEGNVTQTWLDIANRVISLSTLQKYFAAAQKRGMKSMAYNLLYGAYQDASNQGVSNQWRMFSDAGHQNPDFHDLPASWASDIYLIDHSNPNWVSYINREMKKVFDSLPFDGWHIDQLGDRGLRYRYNGTQINMTASYETFINSAKESLKVPLVFNAVNQYGQNYIAKTDVDFLYTEVWYPNESYQSLVNILTNNNIFSNNSLPTVFAAYVNKDLSGSYFNTNSVLFTNAVIFASGGSHLELGEHMLSTEYFPVSRNMHPQLRSAMVRYYDFLTGYQNILRDKIEAFSIAVSSPDYQTAVWPPQKGKIWVFPRAKDNMLILQAVNFTMAATMDWRDSQGLQTEPDLLENVKLTVPLQKTVKKVWYASPDNDLIIPEEIVFSGSIGNYEVIVPRLKYWSMIVMELDEKTTEIGDEINPVKGFNLQQNFPNPFNPVTKIRFDIPETTGVDLDLFNILGENIGSLFSGELQKGSHELEFSGEDLTSGMYLYRLKAGQYTEIKKMILAK